MTSGMIEYNENYKVDVIFMLPKRKYKNHVKIQKKFNRFFKKKAYGFNSILAFGDRFDMKIKKPTYYIIVSLEEKESNKMKFYLYFNKLSSEIYMFLNTL